VGGRWHRLYREMESEPSQTLSKGVA